MKLGDLPIGAIVQHSEAKYLGKPIQWEVVAKKHAGYPTNSVTLQTKQIITAKAMDAQEPKNSNDNRRDYGNNNTTVANLMQWLNSAVSNWYKAQHGADQAPDSKSVVSYNPYASEAGFLTNFPKQFVDAILPTTLTTVIPNADGGGTTKETRKVFLPSRTEVGLGDERSGSPEGSKWEKYTDNNSRKKTRTAEAINQAEISYDEWWLRTPDSSSAYKVCNVYSDGSPFKVDARYGSYGVAPALNLSSDLSVSKVGDVYEVEFNQPPKIESPQPENIGDKNTPFSVDYTVTDGDNDKVKVVEKLNNTTLRTIDSITLGEQQTIEITESQWRALPTNEQSTITITADDGQEVTTKAFTFVKRNNAPLVTLDTKDNEVFYEGSTLNISGTATDADVGDAVIVKYKLASSRERVITTQVSTGEAFDYGKVLTFTKGRFYDGETVVTDVLAEGNTYTLEVWAQDDKGVNSPIQKRKFTVVPNRSPLLEITDTPSVEGAALSTDLSIKGTVNDPDGDDVRLTYKLNNGKEIPVAESGNSFEISFKLSDLKQGRNTFLIIARDEYDAMTTKEVQVTTTAVKSSTEHIENKLYYTIDTKGVETDGILLWLRRPIGDDTDYKGYVSITQTGATEDYQAMEKTTSIVQGHNRDELIGSVSEKGADVRLKLEFDGNEAPIQMLQGVIK